MSWEPVTLWSLRCDGETTRGQCPELCHVEDDDGEPYQVVLWDKRLTPGWVHTLHACGWLFTGTRLLCPRHVAAAEYLVAAELDGLPFQTTTERNCHGWTA